MNCFNDTYITTGTQHVCATLQLTIVKKDFNLMYLYFLKCFCG